MLRHPNRTAQTGTYRTGTPNYVDVSAGSALTGMVTFSAKATDDSWALNDTVGVLVRKDADNYQIWTAIWNSTMTRLEQSVIEDSVGTLADTNTVDVIACPTADTLLSAIHQPVRGTFVEDATTARTLSVDDAGKVIRCTSGSTVTITLADTLPVNFHCLVVREGAGQVDIIRAGTDTVNGGTATISIGTQWAAAYIYQAVEGAWVALV